MKTRSILQKTVIISSIVVVAAFVATFFLFFLGLMEIPLGILLGGGASTGAMALYLIDENSPNHKKAIRVTIVSIILSSLIHISALVLAAVLYYVANLHIFNIFATFGSIFVGQIVYIILNLFPVKEK